MWRLVTIALAVSLLAGCGSDAPPPRSPLALSAANEASLVAIGRRFDALVATLPPDEARAQAIARARDDENVKDATLGQDGISIAVTFRDDRFAFLVTESPGAAGASGLPRARGAWDWRWFAREVTLLPECPDALVPASKRVKIIDAAIGTSPAALDLEDQIVDALEVLGWDPDVDIDNPVEPTLSDLTDLSGYGLVIYIGTAGTMTAPDGESHHYIEGMSEEPLYFDSWEPVVGEEEHARWQALLDEGKLANGYARDADGDWIGGLYVRDDLVAEELGVDPGTTVMLLSPRSETLADEMAQAGVTSYFAMEGTTTWSQAGDAAVGLLYTMGSEGLDGSAAYEALAASEPETVTWSDDARFVDASTGPSAVLPTWLDTSLLDWDAPLDTASLTIRLDHLDCPEASFELERAEGEELIVNGLAPGDTVISVIYRDADGDVIGYATREYRLDGGANAPAVDRCDVSVEIVWPTPPPDTTHFDLTLGWNDPLLLREYVEVERAPLGEPLAFTDVYPGSAFFEVHGFRSAGADDDDWTSGDTKTIELACGANTITLCTGWGVVAPSPLPPGATRASIFTRGEVAGDKLIELAPDEPTDILGHWTDDEVAYTAGAYDAQGNLLGYSASGIVDLGCGARSFDVCFGWLELAPPEVPPGTTTVIAETTAELAPGPLALALDAVTPMTGFAVGDAVTLTTTARDAGGALVGGSTRELTIGCGANAVTPCFGWARLEVAAAPPGTALVRVWRGDEADAVVVPVGGSATMVGFDAAPATFELMAEALDGDGDSLARGSVSATLDDCGESVVPITIVDYGIILQAEPTQIVADGVDEAQLTATLRAYLPDDGPTPTGAPVAGKQVEFVTDLGTLTGPNPVVTGGDGVARIALSGTTRGKATVRAVVTADGKEAVRVVRLGTDGYFEDFESLVGEEWSHHTTMAADGTSWLGPFQHEEVDLTLTDLPQHNRVFLGFDVLVLGFWQGTGCTIHDHDWYAEDGTYMGKVDVAVGTPQLVVLYTAPGASAPGNRLFGTNQVYNQETLCDVEREPLEERTGVLGPEASTYHFELEFQHVDYGETDPLTIRFWEDERIVEGLDWYGIEVTTPRFAIDNVAVDVCMWSAGTGCQ
ncbi:MAG: hypothetical protein IT385_29730 [Deltaproteobacteria bacterium]|nr:hypothetical protein [Deltaproteobacteria bacterium]